MDAFRLLSRSTNLRGGPTRPKADHHIPSEGPTGPLSLPILHSAEITSNGKKRKRHPETGHLSKPVDTSRDARLSYAGEDSRQPSKESPIRAIAGSDGVLSQGECRSILKRHKVKIANITRPRPDLVNIDPPPKKKRSKATSTLDGFLTHNRKQEKENSRVFPQPLISFSQLRPLYHIPTALSENITDQGFTTPTEVQLATIPLLLDYVKAGVADTLVDVTQPDLLTIAPTGSGKTLAFLIPLINRLYRRHHGKNQNKESRHVSALIVAPTKELVGQIVNEGRKLGARTGVQITAMRKGMRLQEENDSTRSDVKSPSSDSENSSSHRTASLIVKSDILVATPLLLVNAISSTGEGGSAGLPTIESLILDEADFLLDPIFRDQTLALWNACTNPFLSVSLWSATIGSNIEELVQSTIQQRQIDLNLPSSNPLFRCIIGVKDSALPTISHKLIYAATESGKLLGLRQLLHPSSTLDNQKRTTPPLRPPFIVFTQTIERVIALQSELLYDIPAEAGGSTRLAVLHSDLSDTKRAEVMTRFRKGQIWVLITTDLLSRGVDFRGVNGVVNYDIPTTSAVYVHRVGRTGRAGREGGIAVTFYTKEDIKYVKGIANVIAASEKAQAQGRTTNSSKGKSNKQEPSYIRSSTGGSTSNAAASKAKNAEPEHEGVQKWLLAALPSISKRDKKILKTRGVDIRRSFRRRRHDGADGADADADAKDSLNNLNLNRKLKARISTKSGYERRRENNRRGAVEGSQRRRLRRRMEEGHTSGRGGDDDDGEEEGEEEWAGITD